jgi:lipid-binding SYLF domain-containing protein
MFAAAALMLLAAGCQTTPETAAKREALVDESQAALKSFEAKDPGIADLVHRGYGYAIFPNVGKGAFVVGGGYGHGSVYEQANFIGYADITQATVGAQIGGGDYAELIIFENRDALERFKNNQLTFNAGASAVIAKTGVAKTAKYENGVMVFTDAKAGAMASAAVGGQKFTFSPGDSATASDKQSADKDKKIETKTTETHEKI